MAKNLPPTIQDLFIYDAEFGKGFVEAVVVCVERWIHMTLLCLNGTKEGGGEGQHVGEWLAAVMSSNKAITELYLKFTDLTGPDNMGKWGEALMRNNDIIKFEMDYGLERDALKNQTEGRTPEL